MKVEQGRPIVEGFHTKVDYISGAYIGRTVVVGDSSGVVWKGVLTEYSAMQLTDRTVYSLTIATSATPLEVRTIRLAMLPAGTGIVIHQEGWRD